MKRFFSHRQRRAGSGTPADDPRRFLDTIVFAPAPGVAPSPLPPVRIFLGTEAAHYRAERVFLWSVLEHRDPARRYEIILMKDLPGFDRTAWTTGFSNYRFAIPYLAGGSGRAIYNDVDQIYLADPGVLFDHDLGDHGFLALSSEDTSVMLIDCARMDSVWQLARARTAPKRELLAGAAALRGDLPAEWNARDEEFREGHSKLLHFTALHLQPWTPEPERFAYRAHPHGERWYELERAADAAGFTVFDRAHPSRRYRELIACCSDLHAHGSGTSGQSAGQTFPGQVLPRHVGSVARLVDAAGARTVLDYGAGKAGAYQSLPDQAPESPVKAMPAWGEDMRVTVYDPAYPPYSEMPEGRFDGVICTDVLEHIAEEDIPWILQELFSHAAAFVYASVACYPAKKVLPNGENAHVCQKPPAWWDAQFRAAARAHPHVHWELSIRKKNWRGKKVRLSRVGGHWLDRPRVWVLGDDKPGNTNQAIALAAALGYDYDLRVLEYGPLAHLHNRLLGASLAGLTHRCAASLAPPWPELVVACGRRTAPVARWIAKRSRGATRVVQLGRKGGDTARPFDVVVTPAHCHLAGDPRRIETLLPLTPLAVAKAAATPAAGATPRTVVLLGGATRRYRFDADVVDDLARRLRADHAAHGGELWVLTSARTGAKALAQLSAALADDARILDPDTLGSRYWETLLAADRIIVSGESESLLADAVATGHPVFIHALPPRPKSLLLRAGAELDRRARRRPTNRRATTRPQRGLEYLCARLIETGLARPPRNLEELHQALYARGVAQPFGSAPTPQDAVHPLPFSAAEEAIDVARRVREALGFGVWTSSAEPPAQDV